MADGTLNFDTKIDSSGFESGANGIGNIIKGIGVEKMIEGAVSKTLELGKACLNVGMGFESSMSQVAATMGITTEEIANGSEDFDRLSAAAKEMGATTQFSASNAADALNYLALAGYDTDKAISTLPTVLNLAAAGGMELGTASDMVTDAMSALGLSTSQASSFVDKMAKTSQKSNTSVSQLGNAILTVGGTAKILKGGVTEMNTVLGVLADNGKKGAEGGTVLRNMIMSLTNPTDKAATALDELGVSVFDAEGNMREMPSILQDLGGALDGMSDRERQNIIGNIFNKADIGAVNSLLGVSSERWEQLASDIDNSSGAAANMAETMNDNLQGAMTMLNSALEGLGIEIYEMFAPALKDIVRFSADSIGKIVQGLQENGVAGALSAASEIVGGLISSFVEGAPAMISSGVDMVMNFIDGIISGYPMALNSAYELIVTIGNAITENLPALLDKGVQLVTQIANGILMNAPAAISAMGNIIAFILTTIMQNHPVIMQKGVQLITNLANGITNNLPAIISAITNVMVNLIRIITSKLPDMLAKGIELIGQLAQGLLNNIPAIVSAIAQGMADLLAEIGNNLPSFLEKGIELIGQVAAGIIEAIPKAVAAVPQVISGIADAFANYDWGSIGSNIIAGIKNGIINGAGAIADAAASAASAAFNAAKGLLGINSPSKVFAWIGRMCDEGLAIGFVENMPRATKQMTNALDKAMGALDASASFTTSFKDGSPSVSGSINSQNRVSGLAWQKRMIELQEEANRNQKELAKRPIYLGTDRIDTNLPKGAVPVL